MIQNFLTAVLTSTAATPTPTAVFSKDTLESLETNLGNFKEYFITTILPVIIRILIAVVIYIVCKKVINWVVKLAKKGMEKAKMEKGVESFLLSLIKIGLYALTIFAIFEVFGLATTTLVAVLGSVGLTIGLALQGSLSNFAGGVLILILKPFVIGDYIVSCGNEGTVTSIDIFYTTLKTPDNKTIVVPNGALSNSNITNVSKEKERRLDFTLPVAYGTDIKLVKEVLQKVFEEDEATLKDKEVTIFLGEFADSSINIGFRVWVNSADYWTAKWRIQETVNDAFAKNNIEIPFNQLDVHMKKEN
ncbi:MAG: mechanosensitive ion channel [Lachnospiraceae bacterium]|nr:mechanosensitive ion channel [Lachnospiraceae bacterium]